MSPHRINAIIATAYNLHIGPHIGGEPMTPAKAARLPKGDRAALCVTLELRGGSDLYSQQDAREAFAAIVS